MKANFAERQAVKIIRRVGGPNAARIAVKVQELAHRQGGANLRQDYGILAKKAALGTAVVAAGVTIGIIAGTVALAKKVTKSASKESRQLGRSDRAVESEIVTAEGDNEAAITRRLDGFYPTYGKRVCDLALSIASLPIVAMVIAGSALAIKLEDGGPVFYNAPRVGKDGKPFTMLKLRSMKVDAPDLVFADGSTYNGSDDPRMTKVGAFLRRTSLDEIPQFLNVLLGDMSVVGPRPDLDREVALYKGDEALKLLVKPGITGYAAVYGRNSLPWHDRLALDVYYVLHLSFLLDVRIFFKTFVAVLDQEGVFVEGEGQKALPAPTEATAQAN